MLLSEPSLYATIIPFLLSGDDPQGRPAAYIFKKTDAAGGNRARDLQISQMMALRRVTKPYESGALTG